jgi:hypothetical protein
MVLNYTADNNRRHPSSCDAPLPSSTGCSLFNQVDVQFERTALCSGGVISNNFGSSRAEELLGMRFVSDKALLSSLQCEKVGPHFMLLAWHMA